MKKSPMITLAVPAFARPKMVEDIIKSYQLQSYKNSELLIIDDCVEDTEVEKVVEFFQKKDDRIRFIKNKTNLGYCKNFLKLLLNAEGKYVVFLGDDDLLINIDALQKYVDVFTKNPKVVYAYSNIIQFNENYEMDYAYITFPKDTLFKSTADSLHGIWLNSCYIPGIGLRNNIDFKSLYPKENILFPQVELIGKMLCTGQAYGIATPLIGGRAHSGQLGFESMKGKRIKGGEKHSVVELSIIFKKVLEFYKKKYDKDLIIDPNLINNFYKKTFPLGLLLTKINLGNMNIIKIAAMAHKQNKKIIYNPSFLVYFIAALILPKRVIYSIKELRKKRVVEKQFTKEKVYFERFIKNIT